MSKKHFVAFANWIATHTSDGSPEEQGALAMVLELAPFFNERFDSERFVAWVRKQRAALA
jgi:hypothetical protein